MIINFIRKMFFGLDKIVYGLIDNVYGLLLQLTRTSVFDQDVIHSFATRVYALIGIFMFFKVSISLLTYLINPDEFANKEKGFGIIIRNVILALVILVIAPYVFNEAFEIQSMILEENTIMNLIFGTQTSDSGETDGTVGHNIAFDNYVNEAGGKIQFTIMYTFAQPNYEEFAHDKTIADLNSCRKTYATDADNNYTFRKKAVIKNGNEKVNANSTSNFIYELNQDCFGIYDSETDTYDMGGTTKGQLWKAFNNEEVNAGIAYQNYAQGVAQQSFSLFFIEDAILAKTKDGRYLINYKWGVSTIVGVAVLYFLIMFCIDVAIRSVKLGFLEMIAPIPIISYCDPKSGKDGMFKKWIDMLWKTYIELFLRLFALYFGIYVISVVGTFRDVVTGDVVDDWLVNVFMIIGILIFVKKLPDILKEVFNVKGDGKFEFNPLKRIENDAIFGKQIAGAARGALGVPGLMAKKTLAGIDYYNNGESFRRGFNSVHGKTLTNLMKKRDELLPKSAETRKSREQARTNIEQREGRMSDNEPRVADVNRALDAAARRTINPATRTPYADAAAWKSANYGEYARAEARVKAQQFKSSTYRDSFTRLADQKVAVTEQQNKVSELQTRYTSVVNGAQTVTYDGHNYTYDSARNEYQYTDASGTIVRTSKSQLEQDMKAELERQSGILASAQGKQEYYQSVHDDNKKIYTSDASVEKGMDEFGKSHSWDSTTQRFT